MEEKKEEIIGIGRRKTAVASVRMKSGSGTVDVNGKKFEEYFVGNIQRQTVMAPLKQFALEGNYDMIVRIKGGGIEGQVEAVRLGIARALVKEDETRRQDLKACGFLTRDPRKRERKKYGLAGARKRFQFSKR